MNGHADPVVEGVIALADLAPGGFLGVLAATLEILDESSLLEWGALSAGSRQRVTRLVADGYRNAPSRALIVRALEDADPAGEVLVALTVAQLASAASRVEVALDNPFGDEDEDRDARHALDRLRDTIRRAAAESRR